MRGTTGWTRTKKFSTEYRAVRAQRTLWHGTFQRRRESLADSAPAGTIGSQIGWFLGAFSGYSHMKQCLAAAVVVFVGLVSRGAGGAEPDPRQAEITQAAQAFVEAYERGDAKAIAAMWTPDADLIDVEGRVLKGRSAIEKDFADFFRENKGQKLRIDVESVRFVGPDMVIEDGTTSALAPDGSGSSRAHYTNVLVKRDGKWMIASVREAPYVPPSNQQNLQPLSWVIGEWADPVETGHQARVLFEWTPDRNFILASREVRVGDKFLDNGTQRIGWDPASKQFRCWNFEPDGGFGDGQWTLQPDGSWNVQTSSVLQSGHKATATTVVTRLDANTITYQAKNQTVDGKPVPDSAVVTMKRIN